MAKVRAPVQGGGSVTKPAAGGSAAPQPCLSEHDIALYRRDGYLVVKNLLSPSEVRAFVDHIEGRAGGEAFGLHGHLCDPQYRYLATHPGIAGHARILSGGRPRIVQTMLLAKAADGGLGIALHQDSHYLPNEPNTLMACWVALTDTDESNGGLCVVPGSHTGGLLQAKRTRNLREHVSWENEHLMRDRNGHEWKQTMVSFDVENLDPATIARLTVPAGSGVFFTGLTVHGSFANRSADRRRLAFAVHYIREDTWLFRCDVQDAMLVDEAREGVRGSQT